jgi:predicted RNase H-like HicB family nuclease
MDKPGVNIEVLDYWSFMNRRNPDGHRTPLSRADVTRLFAYIQLLEERIAESGGKFNDLREYLGLGTGFDGTGIPGRKEVRKRLRELQRRRDHRIEDEQHNARLAMLPLYTARFEAGEECAFFASIDEMRGVFGQGDSLAACMRDLARTVSAVVKFEKEDAPARRRKGRNRDA